jgi:hypothetical protein
VQADQSPFSGVPYAPRSRPETQYITGISSPEDSIYKTVGNHQHRNRSAQLPKMRTIFLYFLGYLPALSAALSNLSPVRIVTEGITALLADVDTTQALRAFNKYFSPDYVQYSNTDFYDHNAYVEHIQASRIGLQSLDIHKLTFIGSTAADTNTSVLYQVGAKYLITAIFTNSTTDEPYSLTFNGISMLEVQAGKIIVGREAVDIA